MNCKKCRKELIKDKDSRGRAINFCNVSCRNSFINSIRKISPETILKHSKWHTGRKLSEDHKKKIGTGVSGERNGMFNNHINKGRFTKEKSSQWRGGITSLAALIRGLDEYKNWRRNIFVRDHYTCQECGQVGYKINAHHSTSFNKLLEGFLNQYHQFSLVEDKYILVRLSITYKPFWEADGKTLCEKCHNNKHKLEGKYYATNARANSR